MNREKPLRRRSRKEAIKVLEKMELTTSIRHQIYLGSNLNRMMMRSTKMRVLIARMSLMTTLQSTMRLMHLSVKTMMMRWISTIFKLTIIRSLKAKKRNS